MAAKKQINIIAYALDLGDNKCTVGMGNCYTVEIMIKLRR